MRKYDVRYLYEAYGAAQTGNEDMLLSSMKQSFAPQTLPKKAWRKFAKVSGLLTRVANDAKEGITVTVTSEEFYDAMNELEKALNSAEK
ncbi:hypothetical protein GOV04_00765 [Candidatus Woesearchaeota archaeon]|nr:hypothetical protein [Candidatus Woesearchaeota archaeon]